MKVFNTIFVNTMQLLPKWSVKPFAKPYVAGIKTDEVLNVVKSLNKNGFSATVDILGEFVSNKDEAIQVKNEYSELVRAIAKNKTSSVLNP